MKKKKPKIYGEATKLQIKDSFKKEKKVKSLIKKAGEYPSSDKAIETYQGAISLGKEIGAMEDVAKAYLGMGAEYQTKRNFEEAKKSFKESQGIYKGLGQQRRAINVQSKLAKMADESGSLGNRILKKVGFATAIIGFLGSVFFMTHGFTGYAIAEINQQGPNLFGVILFLIGIVGLYFWTSRR